MDFTISIYLDKRTIKVDGQRALKLRVYSRKDQKAKFYGLGMKINDDSYDAIKDPSTINRGKNRELQIQLQAIENKAIEIAGKIIPFGFKEFERKMFRNQSEADKVFHYYNKRIETLTKNERINTAESYSLSLSSLSKFLTDTSSKTIESLTFSDIDSDWLEAYERYMVEVKGRSITTVGIYLRNLRAIFNIAKDQKEISDDIYPFGKGATKYQIPTSTGKKKALNQGQLSELFHAKCYSKEQEKGRAFWFFSYALSGMNMKDIALLRNRDIQGDEIQYFRAKTKNTKKHKLEKVRAFMNDYALSVYHKYRVSAELDDYVFGILERGDSAQVRQKKIRNFTRLVNKHINNIGKRIGFDFKVTTYWARHSFATNAIRNGASMEEVSEALNHSNLIVTKTYFAGFEDDHSRNMAKNAMNFTRPSKSKKKRSREKV